MIIDYANFICVAIAPAKHHTPLIVDPNRMQASQITSQLFKPIRRRHAQIFQPGRNVDGYELSFCPLGKAVKRPHDLVLEKRLCLAVAK